MSKKPLVIAHRGASGYRPEHTLESYRLGAMQGADIIEPDLVMTSDAVLVARHDIYLGSTTDVSDRSEFADRKRRHGVRDEWYVSDFTLEELKTLRCRQPFAGRSATYDGRFAIPTFAEILILLKELRSQINPDLAVYPETKAPAYHRERGLDMAEALVRELTDHGLNNDSGGVLIQSFEPWILQDLRGQTPHLLVQLVGRDSPLTLAQIAHWADGVGPDKRLVSRQYTEVAHGRGLMVHPYTYRQDQLPDGATSMEDELAEALALGIDGFFTDFPDIGRKVVDAQFS